jgi:hypothetical protein
MKNLKYILFISLLGIFLFYSTLSKAQEGFQSPETVWGIGDRIIVKAICKDEQDILDMVAVDIKGKLENIITLFNKKVQLGTCKALERPAVFAIHSLVLIYKDYKGMKSIAFALRTVDDINTIVAYTIVQGIPAPLNKNKLKEVHYY